MSDQVLDRINRFVHVVRTERSAAQETLRAIDTKLQTNRQIVLGVMALGFLPAVIFSVYTGTWLWLVSFAIPFTYRSVIHLRLLHQRKLGEQLLQRVMKERANLRELEIVAHAEAICCSRCRAVSLTLNEWIDKQGHDRCWYYPELFRKLTNLFGLTPNPEPALPPRKEFEAGCFRYQDEEYGCGSKQNEGGAGPAAGIR